MFSPRDDQGICDFLVKDRNATIALVTGAWALPLLRSGKTVAEVRTEAARLQKIETEFLKKLSERHVRARVLVWSLLEFLERPADPMQELADNLSGAETQLISELPATKPMRGLHEFLQALRNAGMNPHLAGEAGRVVPPEFQDGESAGKSLR